MNSNNGDLYFKAGIDIKDFLASAKSMEDRMNDVANSVVNGGNSMDTALLKVGSTFASIVGAGSAAAFVKQMFNVRSEMENTEASFRVFLGAAEKAASFMKELQDYAYYNVFEFADLAKESAQLLAFGTAVDDVIPTLNNLSEIAAGTNAPLNELVRVFNKVKSMGKMDAESVESFARFGIDIRQSVADMRTLSEGYEVMRSDIEAASLTFDDLNAVIEKVAGQGGMFYGMMEQKMTTLGDTMGLMHDNITNMFNEIGASTSGVMKGAMGVANTALENYREVAKALATLVLAFGAAKAANIAYSIAQKSGTGVAVLDNTVWAIRAKLLNSQIAPTTEVTKKIRELKVSQEQEIATLKKYISEEEHAQMLSKARKTTLQSILTAEQQHKISQMGLNEESEEYIAIASSMLNQEQKVAFAKAELTNNNAAYIESMKAIIAHRQLDAQNLNEEIKNQEELLSIAERELASKIDLHDAAKNNLKVAQDNVAFQQKEIDIAREIGDVEGEKTAQMALNIAKTKEKAAAEALDTAEENLNTAALQRNTAQQKLNTLTQQKATLATTADTTATAANTTAKGLLSRATMALSTSFKALSAAIKANPLGLLLSAITALVMLIPNLISKIKDNKKAQEEQNKALAEYNKQVQEENNRLNVLRTTIANAGKGTAAYGDAMRKVNSMCEEYNVALLSTNDTLAEQAEKYKELEKAIASTTAAKLKDKFAEEAINSQSERNSGVLSAMREGLQSKGVNSNVRNALYKDGTPTAAGTALENMMEQFATNIANGTMELSDARRRLNKTFESFTGVNVVDAGAVKYLYDALDGLKNSAGETKTELANLDNVLSTFEGNVNSAPIKLQSASEQLAMYRKRVDELNESLREMRNGEIKSENIVQDIETTEKELSTINGKIEALTGKKDAKKAQNDATKALKEYNDAEFELMVEHYQDLAEIENDAYKKRTILIDVEYEKEIRAIEKQRKELLEKKKAAGKGSTLSLAESIAFDTLLAEAEDRRDANKRDAASSVVESMKKTFEEYYKWEEQMGEETARKRFGAMIGEAENYTEWLRQEIARLNNMEFLKDADLEYLYNLQEALNVVSGKTSAVEVFRNETDRLISSTDVLSEKLSILKRRLEELNSVKGNKGEVEAERIRLSSDIADLSDEINRQFDAKYRSFAVNRNAIIAKYSGDMSRLSAEGMTKQAKVMKDAMQRELEDYDRAFLASLVGIGDNMSQGRLKQAIEELMDIQNMTAETFNKMFGLSIDQGQFDALHSQIQSMISEMKELSGYNISDAFKDITSGDDEQKARGVNHLKNTYDALASSISMVADALGDLAEASGNDKLAKLSDTLSGIGNTLSSTASFASAGSAFGPYGAIIGAVLGLGMGIMQEVFGSKAEELAKTQENANAAREYQEGLLENVSSILSAVEGLNDTVASLNYDNFKSALQGFIYDITTNVEGYNGNDYWRSIRNSVLGMNGIGAFIPTGDYSTMLNKLRENGIFSWDEYFEVSGITYIDQAERTAKERAEKIADMLNHQYSELINEQIGLVEELNTLLVSGSYDSMEYFNVNMRAYKSQKELLQWQISVGEAFGQDVSEYQKQLAELEQTMTNSLRSIVESLWGMDVQSLIESWGDIFSEFGDNVEGAFAKIDMGIDEMIANLLRKRLFVEPMLEQLDNIINQYAGEDGEISDEDLLQMTEGIREAKEIALENFQNYTDALASLGISMDDVAGTNTLTGSIQNISEETAGIIAGRLNAMVINQAEGNNILRQSLAVQMAIRTNTTSIAYDLRMLRESNQRGQFNTNLNYGYTH